MYVSGTHIKLLRSIKSTAFVNAAWAAHSEHTRTLSINMLLL